ncbi:MAG TPA: HAMP domain-containing sensor histidine kinase [Candidatus Nitrosopolaris rasttigaisensis]|jgi:two-component system, OmpR family, sensor histidine kinase VicK|nr:HAMP domain-containing sensor histidine kinase [Candidatus Nitrosopolaris rasttigaisensis]
MTTSWKPNKNLKLIQQRTTEAQCGVEGDKYRIIQVISNLLGNTLKFAKDGTVLVNAKNDRKGNEVVDSVKDTGQGLDPEVLPRLFSKFASKSFQGTGLCLFISKGIVEAHGGKMWADNNADGRGATFFFSLPVAH